MTWGTPDKVTYGTGSGDDPTISISLGSTTTGRLLVAFAYNKDTSGFSEYFSDISVGGNSMTEVSSARATIVKFGADYRCQVFWIEDESETGSTNFVFTGDSGDSRIVVYELTGGDNSSPIGAVQIRQNDGSADQTYSLTTANADSTILCGLHGGQDPGAPASGITEDIDQNPTGSILVWAGHRLCTTATSYAVGCTVTNFGITFGASSAVEIKKASASGIAGTLSATLGAVTLSSSADLLIEGTLSGTLADVTLSSEATLTDPPIEGTLSATLADLTLSAAGALPIEGTLTATLADLTLSSAAGLPIEATLSATLADVTLSSAGSVAIGGTLEATLGDMTLSSAGAVAIGATLTATLDDVTLSSAAALAIVGTLSATLDDVTLSATGGIPIAGTLSAALDDVTLSSAGALAISATLTATLGDLTGSGAGELPIGGTLTATLDDVTLSSAAALAIAGSLAATLDDLTLSAVGGGEGIEATLSATLDDLTLASTAVLPIVGTLSATLSAMTLSSAAAVAIEGTLTATLDDLTGSGVADLEIAGTLTATLDDLTLAASGEKSRVGTLAATLDALTVLSHAYGPPSPARICSVIMNVLTADLSGVTIYCNRTRPIEPASLPAIDIRTVNTTRDALDKDYDLESLNLETMIYVRTDEADDAADLRAAQIEAALHGSVLLNAMVTDFSLEATEIEFDDDGDRVQVAATLNWGFEYAVAA